MPGGKLATQSHVTPVDSITDEGKANAKRDVGNQELHLLRRTDGVTKYDRFVNMGVWSSRAIRLSSGLVNL